jgi:hypothetical protein
LAPFIKQFDFQIPRDWQYWQNVSMLQTPTQAQRNISKQDCKPRPRECAIQIIQNFEKDWGKSTGWLRSALCRPLPPRRCDAG